MINYQKVSTKTIDATNFEAIKQIYASEFWSAYLQNDERLLKAFQQSFYLLGAFDGEQLIGFARCVGDGEHVILLQDLIVHRDYQKQGIGTELFNRCSKHFRHVRQFYVVTDLGSSHLHEFYESL